MSCDCTCCHNKTDLVIIGAGPAGYTAAFLAADQGREVTLIDASGVLGGACLHRGCIPSKTLLHCAHTISEARDAIQYGVQFNEPQIDIDQLRDAKIAVIDRLSNGLTQLCKARKVNFISGFVSFISSDIITIQTSDSEQTLKFNKAIIATGSIPTGLPDMPLSDKILDSSAALDLIDIPKELLIIGGGYIGLELGTIYAALGSQITVVEMTDSILPGVDKDLSRILQQKLRKTFKEIKTATKIISLIEADDKIKVVLEDKKGQSEQLFNKALVAIGRRPNTSNLFPQRASVNITDKGFIEVNDSYQTANPNIYAIGDIIGQPMLAHKAASDAARVIDIINGKNIPAKPIIPAVIFTNPQIAWCGISESEAKAQNLDVKITSFPWAANGRALTMGHPEGVTKIIADKTTGKILGIAIVGSEAGELIAEATLAVQNQLTVEQFAHTIHPHPTTSETLKECAELYLNKCPHFK